MQKVKKLSKKIIFLIVFACIVGTIALTALGLAIGFWVADADECWTPDYEMVDIEAVLDKQTLTDEDYALLYAQTGLTRIGIDRALARPVVGKTRILKIQEDYFKPRVVSGSVFGPFVCTDYVDGRMTGIFLENGDIVVTSSTHLSGWRMGHAGLVTNGANNEILQSGVLGETSTVGFMSDFSDRINFMVLTPKVEPELKKEVAAWALENLRGIEFSPFTGFFSDKQKTTKTHCSHLVWYAYNHFGIDLDSNGGPLVASRDIFRSPYVDVVQVFGFDPEKLWY